jgi:HEAT repeat protein
VSEQNSPPNEGPDIVRFDFEVPASPRAPGSPPDPGAGNVLADHILNPDAPEPATGAALDDTPELAAVRNLTQALAKAIKASQLYPIENPMCRRFADELMQKIGEAFGIVDVIRLSVGKTKLFFAGEPVLHQEGGDDSVPGRLFWAGVREISFHMGLTSREALEFLTLFRTSDRLVSDGEGDIVTLLWDGKFEHITYIAIDDILDLENEADPIPSEFGNDFMNFVDLEMHDLDNEEEVDQEAQSMAEQIRAKINDDNDASLFGITPEEREALRQEIEIEESPKMLADMVRIIGETLYLETDEVAFLDLVQVLNGALMALIGEGRLAEAGEVIRMLVELRRDGEHFTPAQQMVIDTGLAASFDPTRRESLARHLDAGKRAGLEALPGFVAALPVESIEGLIELLGNLTTRPARRRMKEALALKAAENVRPFLPFLKDTRTPLVRSVAAILGAAKNDQAQNALKALLKHKDFQVRREGLKALAHLGSGRAMDTLGEALFDRDPRIRMATARYLGTAGRQAIPVLITVIEAEDFDERPLPEKRAFYEALGYAGGEDMLPLMRRAFHRKSLFKRNAVTEIRACVCEALGWIGGAEARELLGEGLQDRSVLVRTAAQSGLRRIAGGKKEPLVREAA